MQIVTAKELGDDTAKFAVAQDHFGRIFVGSHSLLVFDGQTWKSYPKPGNYTLFSLTPAADGIIWAGSNNELGFFKEESLGEFKFHSLLGYLPEKDRDVGPIFRCGPVGRYVYFVGKDKLLRWDGESFKVTSFVSNRRLAPARIGEEFWFQHLETGLFRLTENGPELQFAANQLPEPLIIGLFRDATGLVTVTNDGLRRPGATAAFSPKPLNDYLTQHAATGFCELPDGTLAMSTASGGMVLTTRTGEIIRILADPSTGLPGRGISFLSADPTGEIFGTTPADFFHFPANGHASVYNGLNGLRSRAVNGLALVKSTLYAATEDGLYRQITSEDGHSSFQAIPNLTSRYNQVLPYDGGALLTRFKGVDWFDGSSLREAYALPALSTTAIVRSKIDAKSFYVGEQTGLARLVHLSNGSFERTRLLELADLVVDLHEDPAGRLWIGMAQGASIYDPATKQLASINDPENGQPLTGRVNIIGDERRILVFAGGRVLQTSPQGGQLRGLPGLPTIAAAVIRRVPGEDSLFVACRRSDALIGPLHSAGILSFTADGSASWRELSLPSLDAIGSIRTAVFSEENARPVLWLGGMEGILRLDFEKISSLSSPGAPLIKLAGATQNFSNPDGIPQYPFRGHQLRFQIFTGDSFPSKNWLFESRLGDGSGAWSAPSTSRSFEYSNLSEGIYRFEVRALNTANIPSAPSVFTFRILPPWYRSTQAYLSYGVALLIAVFAFIRIRERQIRARNQELEGLVTVRTAELVKANAAKDEFLAGISHEIRNPMNGVIGIAENFRTETLDGESRRKFSLLRQCASHLSSLLEDILDFSKVQAGAIELDPKPFDLHELVESVAGITRTDSEKYGIPVEVAVSPAVPRKLVGDARRIRQILINFVSNALKFSGRGQVSVTVWCKPAGTQTEVIFAISDEGPGISAEEQARLFTRFERGAAAQKGRVPGTGLGLALCKGLAEKMGGRIWLESELGHGSCFYFSAPFTAVEAAPEAAPVAVAPASAVRTALVVDDQEYNRIVLADLLQGMGFAVQSTQEGQAALDLAARQAFDVVFLDFNLPGLSGVDVARGIRTQPGPSAHALILATTAFNTPEKRAQCLDAGMDAFLGKPVTRERLAKALAGLAPAPTAPVAALPAPEPKKSDGPADRLGNLRLLARKKGVSVADELALYFSELDDELARLNAAIAAENTEDAGRFSHMLCGRCSFIFERELEQVQRRVEAAVGAGRWAEARRDSQEFSTQLAALRVRLASSDSGAAPRA